MTYTVRVRVVVEKRNYQIVGAIALAVLLTNITQPPMLTCNQDDGSKQMTQSTDRLDRIEEIVHSLAVNQTSLQQTVQQLTTKVDTVTTQIERLTTQVEGLTTQVEGLTTQVEIVTNDVGTLTGAIADYIVESESDREIIKQNQAEIRQNQAEIRRIWEYLLGQQRGNGKSTNE
ncbi:MAG: hypothetical protein DSM106950_20205 [Stigonema ocellatum SAG 48.90 = DSM 106950]|nr:hypothetical protein [Stigonema ocellatum SAG 48.90 = DSM 106950]